MLKLLVDVIAGTSGRTQQAAVAALVEVALSASGAPGCARASVAEIDVLLGALATDSEAVRDAGLRGLKGLVRVFSSENHRTIARRTWVARFVPSSHDLIRNRLGKKHFSNFTSITIRVYILNFVQVRSSRREPATGRRTLGHG